MKKTLFALVIISIFALACTTGPEAKPEVSEPIAEESSVESALDADTIVTAVRMKNSELCDTLSSVEQMKTCQTKVADAIVLEGAGQSLDMKACKDIQEDKTKEQCEIVVEANQDKAKAAEDMKKEQEAVNDIVASGDVNDCKDLEEENYRMQCENNIYMKQASDNNDPAPCKNIKDEFSQQSCLIQVTE